MPALLVNVRIDNQEKLELYKVTLAMISDLFTECHIKIRCYYAEECVEYAKLKLKGTVMFYQSLREDDWIAATLEMLNCVKSRSVFSYFEDHKLVAPSSRLKRILKEFDEYELDYLCYSFFRASQLDTVNILPLNPRQYISFDTFDLNKKNLEIIGKLSKTYCTYSSISIASTEYVRGLLKKDNRKIKIFSKLLKIIFHEVPF